MDVSKINESIEILKKELGSGLVTADMWMTGSGQSVAGFNSNPKATALFDQISQSIIKALEVASFDQIDPYYFFRTEDGHTVVVVVQDKYQMGMTVDTTVTPLGLLLNVVLPSVLDKLNQA